MAISFIGASTNVAAASGNISITPPVTQTDDILICAVTTRDNVVLTFPAGWTKYQEANNGTSLRSTLAWKRAVGAEGAFTITHTAGDAIVGNVVVYRGCLATASPINASVMTVNTSSSTCTAASITSIVDGCRLVFTMHDADNGSSSAQSSANLGSLTERFDNLTTLGLDTAVSGADPDSNQATAGASGSSTGTFSLGPDLNNGGNTFLAPAPELSNQPILTRFGLKAGHLKSLHQSNALIARPRFHPFPYFEFPPLGPNPVIPIVTSAWRQWSKLEKKSEEHFFVKHELPRFYQLVPFPQAVLFDYECLLQFDAAKYGGTQVTFFESTIKSANGALVEARLFNVTDGIAVSGSNVSTSSTSFVRQRSAAIFLTGTKEYKAQFIIPPGSIGGSICNARIILEQ